MRYPKGLITALNKYGGVCVCCDEVRPPFLHFVTKNVTEGTIMGQEVSYSYLESHNYPKEYAVLCSNCMWALQQTGYCPHHPPIDNKTPMGVPGEIRVSDVRKRRLGAGEKPSAAERKRLIKARQNTAFEEKYDKYRTSLDPLGDMLRDEQIADHLKEHPFEDIPESLLE